MQYKIGIFGSAVENSKNSVVEKAKILGQTLSQQSNIIIITGASEGLPYAAALEASKNRVKIWGYSPEKDLKSHKKFTPATDSNIYTKLIFVPKSFSFLTNPDACKKYRNVISTASCDAGIIISGRWGSMNEFTNLHDMGKVIGILTKTGGIADEIKSLSKKIFKPSKAIILFDDSPDKLVESVMAELEKRK